MDRYYIGAKSEEKAERIAHEHGLERGQWRRAHGGQPPHLLDGIRVSNRKYLIGEFTTGEWLILTAHLPLDKDNG